MMPNAPGAGAIRALFQNENPERVWTAASDVLGRTDPGYDRRRIGAVFADVVRLFRGEYPGYRAIETLYHDMSHTMDVFLCAVRLTHGVQLSGGRLSGEELTLIMLGALLHDIGYAQKDGEAGGTGAQYTATHVQRGIAFMTEYLDRHGLPPGYVAPLTAIMLSTNPAQAFAAIDFPDPRARLLAQIVASADLVGQMADRAYLEKLLLLYLEFEEAKVGGFESMQDLLRRTGRFYQSTRKKLDGEFSGIYQKLALHFKDWFGVDANYYIESVEKNIAYLEQVLKLDEAEYLNMLRRGGVVQKTVALSRADDAG